MGVTKTEIFSEKENRIADLAKAFSHPARVAILTYLVANKSCICGDLVGALPLSQSTVSQHLKELKRIGIIKGEINPPKVCYCIDEEVWNEAKAIFSDLLSNYQNCCAK